MLALTIDDVLGECDLTIADEACVEGTSGGNLETLVLASLQADAPAQAGDQVDPNAPRAGYWADAYSDGDVWGSRLWTLARSKLVRETALKAEAFAKEALRWLVEDGLATRIEVAGSIEPIPGSRVRAVVLRGTIFSPDGSSTSWGPWEALRGV